LFTFIVGQKHLQEIKTGFLHVGKTHIFTRESDVKKILVQQGIKTYLWPSMPRSRCHSKGRAFRKGALNQHLEKCGHAHG
jgi:hypothetical protein